METYQIVDPAFHQLVEKAVSQRIYSKIQYKTELQEFVTTTSMIKKLDLENGEEFIELLSGEKIRLDRVVSLNGAIALHQQSYMDFSCDC